MYLSDIENPGPNENLMKTIGKNELYFGHKAGNLKYFLAI
jgi:hypothetical protein